MGFTEQADALDALLVRDGRALARDRARARLRGRREQRQAVRRSVGPQGPRREGRRSARSARSTTAGREVRRAQSGARRRRARSARREAIAIAAVRYFLVKFSRGKVIAFDIDEALSFEGETGPYLQYAVVRAEQHLREARASATASTRPASLGAARGRPRRRSTTGDDADELWGLVLEAARLDEIVDSVGAIARAVGAREVRVRPRAGVQRVLSPPADPEGRARGRARCGAPPPSPTSGASSRARST